MGRGKVYTEEERLAREIATNRRTSINYYHNNSERIKANKLNAYIEKRLSEGKEYKPKGINGLIMIDTETGDEFEYRSVKECSEDMDIDGYHISKCLNRGTIYNGYKFKRRREL